MFSQIDMKLEVKLVSNSTLPILILIFQGIGNVQTCFSFSDPTTILLDYPFSSADNCFHKPVLVCLQGQAS